MTSTTSGTSKKAVVIGAGFAGIATALRLRALGYQVTLLERLANLGGRAQVFQRGGYRHDAGPTVITAPFLFDELYELFWVFYPETRDVLHDSKVFNPKNVSQPISYDHLLNARRFNAVIVREENVYGNRAIADYIRGNALFQLLEADRIKESIRNKEIDMWNY